MTYLYVPEKIIIKNLVTDQPVQVKNENGEVSNVVVSFYNFLVSSILKDPVFSANAVTIMHAIDIKDKVKAAPEKSYIEIDKEAVVLLEKAVKTPQTPFNPEVALQLGPFFKSVLQTYDKIPETAA